MKKLMVAVLFLTSVLFADVVKDGYFVGINSGSIKYTEDSKNENMKSIKIGMHFYDENRFLISNRLYLNVDKSKRGDENVVIGNINLEWIWNKIPFVKPFIGFGTGYMYKTKDSVGFFSVGTGILIYLGENIELEGGLRVYNPSKQGSDDWPDKIKKAYAGINISF